MIALQVFVVSVPFAQDLFETTNLSLSQWALAAGVGAAILVLDEVGKRVAAAWNRTPHRLHRAAG